MPAHGEYFQRRLALSEIPPPKNHSSTNTYARAFFPLPSATRRTGKCSRLAFRDGAITLSIRGHPEAAHNRPLSPRLFAVTSVLRPLLPTSPAVGAAFLCCSPLASFAHFADFEEGLLLSNPAQAIPVIGAAASDQNERPTLFSESAGTYISNFISVAAAKKARRRSRSAASEIQVLDHQRFRTSHSGQSPQ